MAPNGMLQEMELENMMEGWTAAEKQLGRMIWDVRRICKEREHCYGPISLSRRQLAAGGGAVAGSSAFVTLMIELTLRMLGT